MKPFATSESHFTQYRKLKRENKNKANKFLMETRRKEDNKPEKNGPGLVRSTLTASACVRSHNISKMHAFPVF